MKKTGIIVGLLLASVVSYLVFLNNFGTPLWVLGLRSRIRGLGALPSNET